MIKLKNVSKTYRIGKVTVRALHNVSLSIEQGEFVAIMGPSGSGKSTLLHILGFLDRPSSGIYSLQGRQVHNFSDDELALLRNNLAGFMFQQFHLLPRISALKNVELPVIYNKNKQLRKGARGKLDAVGLSERVSHKPNELSGGEQQRVAIARALVNEPLVIFADEPTGNLDTKSSEEIIGILKELNRKGKTIVMVTHEQKLAQYAGRMICMRDGEIVSDEIKESEKRKEALADERIAFDSIFENTRKVLNKVELIEHLKQSFYSLVSHKMRSLLSMLGILIGVAAVIAMLAIGEGAKQSISNSLSSLGSNLLVLIPGSKKLQGVSLEAGAVTRFTFEDMDAISKLPQVKYTSPSVGGRAQVVYGNKNWNTQLRGVGVNYPQMHAAVPTYGKFFTDKDVKSRNKVVVLGTTVAKELFGNTNPVNQRIKLNRINFKVIGVFPKKGAMGPQDQDDLVVMPVTTSMYRVVGNEYLDAIEMEIRDVDLIKSATKDVTSLIIKRHNFKNSDFFNVFDTTEIKDTLQSTIRTLTLLLGSIATISLLVGGIGIMNIMLVSVTERTREIGLRKAVGAFKNDILFQFLIEAVVMTFSGGAAGVLVGLGTAAFLSVFAGWAIKVSIFSVILATTFSIAVGVVFGLWPARKAAQLDPIEALRCD
jgi:macrolide transport system ATP-binding/permease protein